MEDEKVLSPKSVRAVINSASWMKFAAVFIMVLTGGYALYYAYTTVKALRMYWRIRRDFGDFDASTATGISFLFWLTLLVQILAILTSFYLCIRLLKASNQFSDFASTKQPTKLDSAFATLRGYWQTMGLFVIVFLVVIVAMVCVTILNYQNTERF